MTFAGIAKAHTTGNTQFKQKGNIFMPENRTLMIHLYCSKFNCLWQK